MRLPKTILPLLAAVVFLPATGWAIPKLQLYVEGATWDETTETWVADDFDPSVGIRLWAIGNLTGPGGTGGTPIKDVKLAIAYSSSESPTFTITPDTMGGTGAYTPPGTTQEFRDDSSTPDTNLAGGPVDTVIASGTDTAPPKPFDYDPGTNSWTGDGGTLGKHSVYGTGTSWQLFSLGDFHTTDDDIANFSGDDPSTPGVEEVFTEFSANAGQVNVYTIKADGLSEGAALHFDLYDHYESGSHVKYVKAPFSHDAGGTSGDGGGGPGAVIPEPGTMVLLGTGLLGIAGVTRRRGKKGKAEEEPAS